MNDSREHREQDGWLDPAVTERLLSGEPVAADADDRVTDLARVLTAASGPLSGDPEHERAALAAFRQAHGGRRTAAARHPRRGFSVRAVLAAAAAVFAVSGVAIAAQTGALTSPFHPGAPHPHSSRPSTAPAQLPTSHSAVPGTDDPPTSAPPSPSAHPTPHGTPGIPPAATLKKLCQTWAKSAQHGENLDTPSRNHLERAAGGSDHIAAYCAQLPGKGGDKGSGGGRTGNSGGDKGSSQGKSPSGRSTPTPDPKSS
ncbi:hypothetical protein AB0M29_16250 [Streptomyces sp. NPDC051976]|uniref:hypothetical protein n=1 Tax=Streptomyces sp. NPDC051976 TaxID=3154947 RepID=UPI0034174DF3